MATFNEQLMTRLAKIELVKFDFVNGELVEGVQGLHFSEDNGVVYISAEHGDGAADYYGEFQTGDDYGQPHVHAKIVAVAEALGSYVEWVNPGQLAIYNQG